MPLKGGRLVADRQPTAMMQNFAETRSPRSVSTRQQFAASSKVAAVTRVSKRISGRRPKRSVDMIGVSEDFRLRRIFLRPVPLLVELFRERERILHALDVAARAGIAVPVPGAADTAAGLIDPRLKAEPAQPVQHIEAGETRADHDGVEFCADFRVTFLWFVRAGHGSFFYRSLSRLMPSADIA